MNTSTSLNVTVASLFSNFNSVTSEVTKRPSNKERVRTAIEDAGGESLSVSEISEATGLPEQAVKAHVKALCNAKADTRCIWEDETQEDHYAYESPIVDKIVIGF